MPWLHAVKSTSSPVLGTVGESAWENWVFLVLQNYMAPVKCQKSFHTVKKSSLRRYYLLSKLMGSLSVLLSSQCYFETRKPNAHFPVCYWLPPAPPPLPLDTSSTLQCPLWGAPVQGLGSQGHFPELCCPQLTYSPVQLSTASLWSPSFRSSLVHFASKS